LPFLIVGIILPGREETYPKYSICSPDPVSCSSRVGRKPPLLGEDEVDEGIILPGREETF